MRKTLDREERWVKVHAAEYLLALDYPQGVEETYLEELKRFENEPQYRVGIWRVLARTAVSEAEQNHWIEKIRGVFLDPSASDRGHAAETLAKLKYQVREQGDELFDRDAQGKDESLAVGVNWILANSDKEAGVEGLGRLLGVGRPEDPRLRGLCLAPSGDGDGPRADSRQTCGGLRTSRRIRPPGHTSLRPRRSMRGPATRRRWRHCARSPASARTEIATRHVTRWRASARWTISRCWCV